MACHDANIKHQDIKSLQHTSQSAAGKQSFGPHHAHRRLRPRAPPRRRRGVRAERRAPPPAEPAGHGDRDGGQGEPEDRERHHRADRQHADGQAQPRVRRGHQRDLQGGRARGAAAASACFSVSCWVLLPRPLFAPRTTTATVRARARRVRRRCRTPIISLLAVRRDALYAPATARAVRHLLPRHRTVYVW